MIKKLWNSPLSIWKLLVILLYRFILKLLFLSGSAFDKVFFNTTNKPLKSPVFIIGHPRSGTTFLHRYLMNHITELQGILLWRVAIPYLSLQKLFKPLVKIIDKYLFSKIYDPVIHKTGLFKGETDDIALFIKSFEGLFYWLYFKAFKKYSSITELRSDLIDSAKLDKMLEQINKIHIKSLFSERITKKRALSKSFSLILNIEQVLEKFPDAKIIILIREPKETIPSSMSLSYSMLKKIFCVNKISDEKLTLYYENIYQASLLFYEKLFQAQLKYEKNQSVHWVFYKDLINNFSFTMNNILDFLDIEKSVYSDVIKRQEEKQKNFKSKHLYSLEKFNLSKRKIEKDLEYFYDYNLIKL